MIPDAAVIQAPARLIQSTCRRSGNKTRTSKRVVEFRSAEFVLIGEDVTMSITLPGESPEYRAARDDLLAKEIELRRAMEAVAVARRGGARRSGGS